MNQTDRQPKARRKTAARLYAVQALFQMEASGESADKVIEEFLSHRIGAEDEGLHWAEAHATLFRTLVREAVNHQARIDQATNAALVDRWPIDRIDPTLRAIFRAAGAELVAGEAPVGVVISEFVEIAKDFYPEGRQPKLVNAVLDAMAKALRS